MEFVSVEVNFAATNGFQEKCRDLVFSGLFCYFEWKAKIKKVVVHCLRQGSKRKYFSES